MRPAAVAVTHTHSEAAAMAYAGPDTSTGPPVTLP